MSNEKIVGEGIEQFFDVGGEFDGDKREQNNNAVDKISELAHSDEMVVEKGLVDAVLPPDYGQGEETAAIKNDRVSSAGSVSDIVEQAKEISISMGPAELNEAVEELSSALIEKEGNK